ncbi:hypothetical protein B8V81_2023 [Paenibacillus pasadenensis]|uniref:Uncharacterized protein n=1 Tax=Paenibacillus pasadenensis TaxID=217090 RepID=A0A2N5MZV5_9BACL|nr:hypothetical protein B8V81_2023 [Paenibacillus pasadenensis]
MLCLAFQSQCFHGASSPSVHRVASRLSRRADPYSMRHSSPSQ